VYRVAPDTALHVTIAEPFAAVTVAPVGALVGATAWAVCGAAAADTVIEIVAVALAVPSVAVTVNTVDAIVVDGVPEMTPVEVLSTNPVGREAPPAPAIEYVTVPVKFAGLNAAVFAIGVFCVAVSVGVPPDIAAAAVSNTVIFIVEVAVRAGVEESVAVIVKTVLANVPVGVPVITPVAAAINKPFGRAGVIV
jgi:hypothetical protein